jgi:nicotinamide-nucleotide amidase
MPVGSRSMAHEATSPNAAARRVARLLARGNCKVVFAESCTGGLVSGELTKIAGISEHHCGGMVVYRNATKIAYLGIPADLLVHPGPVSPEVADQMALRVLRKTPEADIAVSVTGHLGPNAPAELDGRVFVGIARRNAKNRRAKAPQVTVTPLICPRANRQKRQQWLVQQVLDLLGDELQAAIDNERRTNTS